MIERYRYVTVPVGRSYMVTRRMETHYGAWVVSPTECHGKPMVRVQSMLRMGMGFERVARVHIRHTVDGPEGLSVVQNF